MSKQITVEDFAITDILIDVIRQKVVVQWRELTDINTVYRKGEVTFWVTMPTEPNPGNWIEMPQAMKTFLANEIPKLNNLMDPIINPV